MWSNQWARNGFIRPVVQASAIPRSGKRRGFSDRLIIGRVHPSDLRCQRIFEPVQLFARRFEVVLKEPNPLFVFDEGARLQLQDLPLELSNAQVAEIVIGVRAVLSFRIVRHVISRPFSPQSVFQKRISISRIFALLPARGSYGVLQFPGFRDIAEAIGYREDRALVGPRRTLDNNHLRGVQTLKRGLESNSRSTFASPARVERLGPLRRVAVGRASTQNSQSLF